LHIFTAYVIGYSVMLPQPTYTQIVESALSFFVHK